MFRSGNRPGRAGGSARRRAAAGLAEACLVGVAAAGLVLLLGGGVAGAEPPVTLDAPGQITDRVDALGDRRDEVEAALDRLRDEDDVQLFVVYVDSFDGMGGQAWTDETAVSNGLGLNDILLAVAVGDRQYAWSVDQDFPLSDGALQDVAADGIEPRLADDDWAGAAIAAADGYAASLDAGSETEGGSDDDGGLPWGLLLLAAVVGFAVLVVLVWLGGRRSRARARAGGGEGAPADGSPPDPYLEVPTDDLGKRAGGLLVETDDAVKTSEQEVAFAEAEFGADAVAPFHAAIETARAELSSAFTIWQALQDSEPEEEAERRTMLIQVIEHCERADQGLDAETARFDELRDRARRTPEIVAGLRSEVGALEARLPQADATVAELAGTYPRAAAARPEADLDEARDRLAAAQELLGQADAAMASGDQNDAALVTRAAEEAVGQTRTLLDGVDRAEADLRDASARLPALLAEVRKDLAEAEAHGGQAEAEPELAAAMVAARAALAAAEGAPSTGGSPDDGAPQGEPVAGIDPVATSRGLEQADAALDAALAGRRDAQARRDRARAMLDHTIGSARSQIAAVQDFVTTRRGAIGPEARAQLAEAQRHLDRALAAADEDPEEALRDAETAASLAERATQSAQSDTDDYRSGSFPGRGGGGMGSLGGMVLGGILLDTVLRSGRGGGWGGGFGGGGGGRRSGGGFSVGGFGGSGSRRRGGGGRF